MMVVNRIANGPRKRNKLAIKNAIKNNANAKRAKASINATAVVAFAISRIENFIGLKRGDASEDYALKVWDNGQKTTLLKTSVHNAVPPFLRSRTQHRGT